MTKLSRDDVLKLAQLARLQLTDDEIAEFSSELSSILGYVEKLQTVNTDKLEPTNQVSGLTNVTRADQPIDYGYKATDLLKNVPKTDNGQIKTARMIQ